MPQSDDRAFLDDLLDNPCNSLVEEAISEGRVPIGYTCSLVPEPLLSLGKFFPWRVRAHDVTATDSAEVYLSPVLCSYARSVLEKALDGSLDFLGGMVVAASCDHIRRAGQNIERLGAHPKDDSYFMHFLDTPRKINETLLDWFARDMRRLAATMASKYGVDASDEALRAEIVKLNEFNAKLMAVSELRKQVPSPITGTDFQKLMVAARVAPKDKVAKKLDDFAKAAVKNAKKNDGKPRIMIIGSSNDDIRYTEVVESLGCVVVADRYCWGALPGLEPIKVEGDPFMNLAEHYLEICNCPRMMERYQDRIEYAVNIAKEYKVDGVIYENMKFCELWGFETTTLIDGLRNAGIPLVRIERDYNLHGEGQLRTRVQAFLESIQGKRENAALGK